MASIHWLGDASGNFATGALWTGGVVPGAADDAILDAAGLLNYTVTSAVSETVNSIQTAKTATLDITGGTFTASSGTGSGANAGAITVETNTIFSVTGTLNNSGQITINNTNNSYNTDMVIGAAGATLTGGGAVTLTDDANNRLYGAVAGATLTNVDNTISGAGQLGLNKLTLINDVGGTIDATGSNFLFLQTSAPVINAGLIEATGAAGLVIRGTTVDGSSGGHLLASDSSIFLGSADVVGGTLEVAGGGAFHTNDAGSILDSTKSVVTNAGIIDIDTNTALTLLGTQNNTGQINLNNGNDSYNTDLIIGAGGATLSGGGALTLSDDANNRVYDQNGGGTDTLTNVDNTISGAGQLGINRLTLVNDVGGTIDANGTVALILQTNIAVTNAGLIEATGAGGLTIFDTTVDDSSGGTLFANNAIVRLQGATIIGGTLNIAGAGAFDTVGGYGATLDSSKFAVGNADLINVVTNSSLTLIGAANNSGTINVNNANDSYVTDLIIGAGGATLTGGGALTLSDDANNRIYDLNASGVDTLTNVDNTISGGGQFGIGRLTLVNQAKGIIDATGASALVLDTGGHAVVNAGLIESTNPSKLGAVGGLQIVNTTIANSQTGVIEANGAGTHVDLFSATISGGTLVTINGGVFQTRDSGSVLDGLSVAAVNNTGTIDLPTNTLLTIKGALINTGQVDLNNANDSYVTDLVIGAGGATLTGKGAVTLSDDPNNRIYGNGNTLTNVDNTISGAGDLGVGQLTLVNDAGGTIDANGTHALVLQTNTAVANAGLIEATNTGGLTIVSTTVDDSSGGVLFANGSPIRLQSATIVGGTLKDQSGGAFYTTDSGSLLDASKSAITDSATIVIGTNTLLTIKGALINTGQIDLNNANDSYVTDLVIGAGGATLTGGGAVTLSNDANNRIYGSGATLTNVDNTISGAGDLGVGQLTLVNDAGGTIDANGTHALVLQTNTAVANAGLIEATNTGGLTIVSTTVDDSSGGVLFANGSPIRLQSATIVGGTLKDQSGGAFYTANNASVLDSSSHTINNAATINVGTNTALTILGTLNNTGQIDVSNANDSYNTDLLIGAGATLTGKGALTLSDDANNRVYGSGNTLTNVDNTISGAGQFGVGQLTLVNDAGGTIDATGSHALIINTGANTITNAGLIEATGAGGLNIQSAVTNTGVLETNGGNITVSGAYSGLGGSTLILTGTIDFTSTYAGAATFSGPAGILELAQSQTFAGSVSGFSTHGGGNADELDLVDIASAGATAKFSGTATSGTLTVTGGTHTANITLLGNYTQSNFSTAGDGHGGTLVFLNGQTPFTMADSYNDPVNQTLNINAAAGVLANDIDTNGLTFTAALNTGPAHGAVTLNPDGSFTYTPNAGFTGKDSFTYVAKDAIATSAPVTVTLNINAGTPVSNPDAYGDGAGKALAVNAATGVLANDTDPNGLTLTAALNSNPAHGVVTLNADGSFNYTPTLGFAGKDTFTYIASDGVASGPPTTVTVTVTASAPTSTADSYGDGAGHVLKVNAATGVLANDVDNNGLALSAAVSTGPAHGVVTVNADGSFNYTPTLGFAGKDSFTYVASDILSVGAPTTVTLNVSATAPTSMADTYSDGANQILTVAAAAGVLANDTDNNGLALTAALATGPAHGAVTVNADGSFKYTPNAGFTGKDSFTYIPGDSLSVGAPTTVTVNVGAGTPVSNPDAYGDGAGKALAVNAATGVLANDIDPNGLTLTAALATGPTHGAVALNADGSFNYTPTLGFAGKDTFTYIASDGVASGPPTTVTITVTASAPTSTADSYGDGAGHALKVAAGAGILANDVDNNGLALTAALATGPTHGVASVNADGSFNYTPTLGFAGKDAFTYIASDSLSTGAPTTVTVNVTASPPTSTADSYNDGTNQPLSVSAATGLLTNDVDNNGLALTAALSTGPAHGVVAVNGDGSFKYTPTAGFSGKDTFTYIASDSLSTGAPTTVTLNVGAAGPTANPDTYADGPGQLLLVIAKNGVLANDVDPNHLLMTAALAPGGGPTHGTLMLNAQGAFRYTPNAGFVGADTFTYIASDTVGSSAPTPVTINVTAGSPVSNADTYGDGAGHGLNVNAAGGVLANDSDPNGLALTASLAAGPAHGVLGLNKDGSFSYTPALGFAGKDAFTYIASDGVASGPATTVTLNVAAAAPTSMADSYADSVGTTLAIAAGAGVLANDIDNNGLALTAALATGPGHGVVTLNADGSFKYAPTAGFTGKDSFTYIASDTLAAGAPTTVTVSVANGAPVANPDSYTDGAGHALSVAAAAGLLANDTDPNGLPLTAVLGAGPAHGVVTLNADGSFNYTPTLGYAGKDSFTYTAKDSLASSAATTVSLAVAAAAPTSAPDSYAASVGHALTVGASGGVLANDADNNGLALTAALASGSAHGALMFNADGSFTYTPVAGFSGKDSFSYIASDSLTSGAPTTVSLTVAGGAPVSNPDSYSDTAGHTLAVGAVAGVLANDVDPNGLTLTAALATGPAHGSVSLNKDGSFNYTPAVGFLGKDSFTYIASDSVASGAATTVALTVTGGAPLSNADSYTDATGHALTVSAASGVLANDTDPNGLALTAALASGPAHGILTLNASGAFNYAPTAGFVGKDAFTYIASDGEAIGAVTPVTLNVTASAPTTTPDAYSAVANKMLNVSAAGGVLANDTDPNGLALTAQLAPHGGPTHGALVLNANGSFSYILHAGFGGFVGMDTFTYIATDGSASSAPTRVTINITNGAASAPTALAQAAPLSDAASALAAPPSIAAAQVAAPASAASTFHLADASSLAFVAASPSPTFAQTAAHSLGLESSVDEISGATLAHLGGVDAVGTLSWTYDPSHLLAQASALHSEAAQWHHIL